MPTAEQLSTLLREPAAWLYRTRDGMIGPGVDRPRLVFPGSFNPLHRGHQALARVAEEQLGEPLAYELSIVNVDKPPLAPAEVQRRLEQFRGRTVCVTSAPLFATKAELFPQATFVIGADTAIRIVDAKYYTQGEHGLFAALQLIRERGCRFFVGGRVNQHGDFLDVERLTIPVHFRDLFIGLREEQFRVDLSSTELRQSC